MPFNTKDTLKAHLRDDFLTACFANLDGEDFNTALEFSAGIVTQKTGVTAPADVSTSDKVLQGCDAWIFAFFVTDKIEGLESEILTLIPQKYKAVMALLKDWGKDNARNQEESTIKAEHRSSNWFTDISGATRNRRCLDGGFCDE